MDDHHYFMQPGDSGTNAGSLNQAGTQKRPVVLGVVNTSGMKSSNQKRKRRWDQPPEEIDVTSKRVCMNETVLNNEIESSSSLNTTDSDKNSDFYIDVNSLINVNNDNVLIESDSRPNLCKESDSSDGSVTKLESRENEAHQLETSEQCELETIETREQCEIENERTLETVNTSVIVENIADESMLVNTSLNTSQICDGNSVSTNNNSDDEADYGREPVDNITYVSSMSDSLKQIQYYDEEDSDTGDSDQSEKVNKADLSQPISTERERSDSSEMSDKIASDNFINNDNDKADTIESDCNDVSTIDVTLISNSATDCNVVHSEFLNKNDAFGDNKTELPTSTNESIDTVQVINNESNNSQCVNVPNELRTVDNSFLREESPIIFNVCLEVKDVNLSVTGKTESLSHKIDVTSDGDSSEVHFEKEGGGTLMEVPFNQEVHQGSVLEIDSNESIKLSDASKTTESNCDLEMQTSAIDETFHSEELHSREELSAFRSILTTKEETFSKKEVLAVEDDFTFGNDTVGLTEHDQDDGSIPEDHVKLFKKTQAKYEIDIKRVTLSEDLVKETSSNESWKTVVTFDEDKVISEGGINLGETSELKAVAFEVKEDSNDKLEYLSPTGGSELQSDDQIPEIPSDEPIETLKEHPIALAVPLVEINPLLESVKEVVSVELTNKTELSERSGSDDKILSNNEEEVISKIIATQNEDCSTGIKEGSKIERNNLIVTVPNEDIPEFAIVDDLNESINIEETENEVIIETEDVESLFDDNIENQDILMEVDAEFEDTKRLLCNEIDVDNENIQSAHSSLMVDEDVDSVHLTGVQLSKLDENDQFKSKGAAEVTQTTEEIITIKEPALELETVAAYSKSVNSIPPLDSTSALLPETVLVEEISACFGNKDKARDIELNLNPQSSDLSSISKALSPDEQYIECKIKVAENLNVRAGFESKDKALDIELNPESSDLSSISKALSPDEQHMECKIKVAEDININTCFQSKKKVLDVEINPQSSDSSSISKAVPSDVQHMECKIKVAEDIININSGPLETNMFETFCQTSLSKPAAASAVTDTSAPITITNSGNKSTEENISSRIQHQTSGIFEMNVEQLSFGKSKENSDFSERSEINKLDHSETCENNSSLEQVKNKFVKEHTIKKNSEDPLKEEGLETLKRDKNPDTDSEVRAEPDTITDSSPVGSLSETTLSKVICTSGSVDIDSKGIQPIEDTTSLDSNFDLGKDEQIRQMEVISAVEAISEVEVSEQEQELGIEEIVEVSEKNDLQSMEDVFAIESITECKVVEEIHLMDDSYELEMIAQTLKKDDTDVSVVSSSTELEIGIVKEQNYNVILSRLEDVVKETSSNESWKTVVTFDEDKVIKEGMKNLVRKEDLKASCILEIKDDSTDKLEYLSPTSGSDDQLAEIPSVGTKDSASKLAAVAVEISSGTKKIENADIQVQDSISDLKEEIIFEETVDNNMEENDKKPCFTPPEHAVRLIADDDVKVNFVNVECDTVKNEETCKKQDVPEKVEYDPANKEEVEEEVETGIVFGEDVEEEIEDDMEASICIQETNNEVEIESEEMGFLFGKISNNEEIRLEGDADPGIIGSSNTANEKMEVDVGQSKERNVIVEKIFDCGLLMESEKIATDRNVVEIVNEDTTGRMEKPVETVHRIIPEQIDADDENITAEKLEEQKDDLDINKIMEPSVSDTSWSGKQSEHDSLVVPLLKTVSSCKISDIEKHGEKEQKVLNFQPNLMTTVGELQKQVQQSTQKLEPITLRIYKDNLSIRTDDLDSPNKKHRSPTLAAELKSQLSPQVKGSPSRASSPQTKQLEFTLKIAKDANTNFPKATMSPKSNLSPSGLVWKSDMSPCSSIVNKESHSPGHASPTPPESTLNKLKLKICKPNENMEFTTQSISGIVLETKSSPLRCTESSTCETSLNVCAQTSSKLEEFRPPKAHLKLETMFKKMLESQQENKSNIRSGDKISSTVVSDVDPAITSEKIAEPLVSVAVQPVIPTPRKRGRPRKIVTLPLELPVTREASNCGEMQQSFSVPDSASADNLNRPMRSCRGRTKPIVVRTRKPRGGGIIRGGARGRGITRITPDRETLTEYEKAELAKIEAKKERLRAESIARYEAKKAKKLAKKLKDEERRKRLAREKAEKAEAAAPQVFEEETRMSAPDNSNSRGHTPYRSSNQTDGAAGGEESQNSVSNTTSTGHIKRGRMEVQCDYESKEIRVDQLAEYHWQGSELSMIQEQVSLYLGVKSFKRKYPDLKRRPVEAEERTYLEDSGLVPKSMCDLGITAVSSAEVLDIMFHDFPEKYEEFRKYVREKQAREVSSKQKALASMRRDGSKIEPREQALEAVASWNANLNRERKEERRCALDLQTFTIHYPKTDRNSMTRPVPKVGLYPIALIPGQYCDYYKQYTPTELMYFPLNTVVYGPLKPNERQQAGASDDGSASDSDTSSSDDSSESSSDSSASSTEEQDDTITKCCKICKTSKKTKDSSTSLLESSLIQCAHCKSYYHASCQDFSEEMLPHIRKYDWSCIDCKKCLTCKCRGNVDKILCCDLCDRGHHVECLGLKKVPERWHCTVCAYCTNCGSRDPGAPDWQHEYKKGDKGMKVYLRTLCATCCKMANVII